MGCRKLQVIFRKRATNYRALCLALYLACDLRPTNHEPVYGIRHIGERIRGCASAVLRVCNMIELVHAKLTHTYAAIYTTHCNTLQHTAIHCNTLQHTAAHRNTLQHIATHICRYMYNTLQHTATHCNKLQHTATHCNTLQHTATHCNTYAAARRLSCMPVGCAMVMLSVF